jgi:hypothetical protein
MVNIENSIQKSTIVNSPVDTKTIVNQKKCSAKKGDYPCTIFGSPWCDDCALYK